MSRIPLVFLAFISVLFASDSGRLYNLYQTGHYQQACDEGVTKLRSHQQDERYISLYAFACLKADEIDRLALPIIMLKNTKESRKNAAYFSAILLQKNLLVTALENHQALDSLNLPSTDTVLSKVFDLYTAKRFVYTNGVYVFNDPKNHRLTYRLYLNTSGKSPSLVIDEYYDTILSKQHFYR